jgi:hypothetical protein
MVTSDSDVDTVGENEVIKGAGMKLNPLLVVVPKGVVTAIAPDAPPSTTALIRLEETTVNDLAGTPPKLTAVAPERFVPLIAMVLPTPPLFGLNEMIPGMGV